MVGARPASDGVQVLAAELEPLAEHDQLAIFVANIDLLAAE